MMAARQGAGERRVGAAARAAGTLPTQQDTTKYKDDPY